MANMNIQILKFFLFVSVSDLVSYIAKHEYSDSEVCFCSESSLVNMPTVNTRSSAFTPEKVVEAVGQESSSGKWRGRLAVIVGQARCCGRGSFLLCSLLSKHW